MNAIVPPGYDDLIPKAIPPSHAAFWETPLGWLGFSAFSVFVVVVLVLLFILAMKVLYWMTFIITRGVHDGWTPTHTKIARGLLRK